MTLAVRVEGEAHVVFSRHACRRLRERAGMRVRDGKWEVASGLRDGRCEHLGRNLFQVGTPGERAYVVALVGPGEAVVLTVLRDRAEAA